MATARYWRLTGIESYAGDDLELSALHLYDKTGRIDSTATLSCSHAPTAGALANLQDNDTVSTCRFADDQVRAPGFFLQWDFGPASGVEVEGLRFGGATQKDDFLAQCDLSYLSAGSSWVKVATLGRIIWPGEATLSAVVKVGDEYARDVVLALACDGVNGSSVFPDLSPKGRTVTASGGAQISTTQSKFGGASAEFNGSTRYLYTPASADFDFGIDDFTIELWAWRHNLTNAYGHFFCVGNQAVFTFKHWGAGLYCFSAASGLLCFVTGVFPAEEMCHLALVRSGSVFKIYVNGVQKATSTYAGGMGSSSNVVNIGRGNVDEGYEYFNGYIDDLRVTKGIARYTSDFTPPTVANAASVEGVEASRVYVGQPSGAEVVAAAVVPAHCTHKLRRVETARDVEFGGSGRIWGTTKIELSPGIRVPAKGRVSILRERDKLLAREVWSDPVTGAWEVGGLDARQSFIPLAQDPAGNYMPAAADRTRPEELP